MFRRAQELTDKLRQFGSELLGVLEKKDAEELSLLQNRQEAVLLALNGDIKQAQIRIAEENVAELTAGLAAANERVTHYQQLLAEGMTPLEEAQLGLMATAVAAHFSAGILKVAAGIAYVVPQTKIGPFIIGIEHGGRQLGDSLDKAGEVAESLGEGFSMLGEVLGMRANHERTAQDWALQLRTAQNDVVQIGHQLAGAQQEVAVARREAEVHRAEVEHNAAVGRFMRDKFGTAELYGWMAGQLSGSYFQTYQLAYELARAAERAYQFERGLDGSAVHIRPSYWDSRRSGLLAGNALGLDLDRLGQAYLLGDERGLEITKQVSLMELDPLALLKLRTSGVCDFALTEAELDHDFPGHYRRQIRTVTVAFLDAGGPAAVGERDADPAGPSRPCWSPIPRRSLTCSTRRAPRRTRSDRTGGPASRSHCPRWTVTTTGCSSCATTTSGTCRSRARARSPGGGCSAPAGSPRRRTTSC